VNPYALLDPAVAAAHALVALIAGHLPWAGGSAVATALALVTLAARAALLPLTVRTLRAERARAALAPRLADLRRRHGGDPARLLAETARIHREAGVPQTAGLLPALAQLPVVATLYRLVLVPTVAGHPNLVLTSRLFGAPLAAHWPEVLAGGGLVGPGTLACAVLLGALIALATVSARDVARRATEAGAGASSAAPAAQPAALTRVLRLLPFGTVLFAAVSPVAVGIYLLVSTGWSVAERRLLPHAFPA